MTATSFNTTVFYPTLAKSEKWLIDYNFPTLTGVSYSQNLNAIEIFEFLGITKTWIGSKKTTN